LQSRCKISLSSSLTQLTEEARILRLTPAAVQVLVCSSAPPTRYEKKVKIAIKPLSQLQILNRTVQREHTRTENVSCFETNAECPTEKERVRAWAARRTHDPLLCAGLQKTRSRDSPARRWQANVRKAFEPKIRVRPGMRCTARLISDVELPRAKHDA
jgi:hypothetical protein